MNRYFSSFFITAAIYTVAVILLVYLLNSDNCDADTSIEKSKVIRVSLVNIQKQIKQENKAQEDKPTKKEVVKKIKKAVNKPHVQKKPTIELKKEKIDEKKVLQDVVKEEAIEKPTEENVEEVVKKEEPLKTKKYEKLQEKKTQEEELQNSAAAQSVVVSNEDLHRRQESFFLNLRKLIDRNKSYPNSARRRGIQGNVEMMFSIMQNGHVKSIRMVSGKSIFQRSAVNAIEKSFPIDVDKTLFSFPKEFRITIAYILK